MLNPDGTVKVQSFASSPDVLDALMKIEQKKRGRPKKVVVETPTPTPTQATTEVKPEALPVYTPVYTITLNMNGEISEGTGTSMLEALQNLPRPDKITIKSTIKVDCDGKSKELYFVPSKLKKVFYPMAQYITAKTFAMALK